MAPTTDNTKQIHELVIDELKAEFKRLRIEGVEIVYHAKDKKIVAEAKKGIEESTFKMLNEALQDSGINTINMDGKIIFSNSIEDTNGKIGAIKESLDVKFGLEAVLKNIDTTVKGQEVALNGKIGMLNKLLADILPKGAEFKLKGGKESGAPKVTLHLKKGDIRLGDTLSECLGETELTSGKYKFKKDRFKGKDDFYVVINDSEALRKISQEALQTLSSSIHSKLEK